MKCYFCEKEASFLIELSIGRKLPVCDENNDYLDDITLEKVMDLKTCSECLSLAEEGGIIFFPKESSVAIYEKGD